MVIHMEYKITKIDRINGFVWFDVLYSDGSICKQDNLIPINAVESLWQQMTPTLTLVAA